MPNDDLTKKRRNVKAAKIAVEVDPQAGGFFRQCLERAALLGMEYADQEQTTKTMIEK